MNAESADATTDGYRATVRALLHQRLPDDWTGLGGLAEDEAEDFVARWRHTLFDLKLLAPTWPAQYGGMDVGQTEYLAHLEEFERARVPIGGPNDTNGIRLLGNTVLALGTEEQKRYFLPRILSGEHRWCQGFSEPNAGSDLAGVRTTAELDGDEWRINGQKVWTTAAMSANWMFLLARTSNDPIRHQGLTFLLLPMDQEGVDVRPLRQISGGADFNEVFLTDARTPRAHVLGAVGAGWMVAMTMLGFERGSSARILPIRLRQELDRLLLLAEQEPDSLSPALRQQMAWCICRLRVLEHLGDLVTFRATRDGAPGAEAAVFKLMWSEYHRVVARLGVSMQGRHALHVTGRHPIAVDDTDDPGAPNSSASWTSVFLNAQAGTIYAGTSNIQRNIIGERLLGLPK